jgi:steroid delta-isomerase-like uncharacterized protein
MIHPKVMKLKSRDYNNIQHTFRKWQNAFRTRDIPRMAELLTDNIKIDSLTFGSYNGIKEASKYWDELFEAFPDIKINPVTITTDNRENRVLTEMDISGTQKGKVGSTPGFGKKFRIRGVFVYDFMGYKIKEIRMYYDSSILKRQLNILKT